MTEVVTTQAVLSDSVLKTRPAFQSYLKTDANAGGDVVKQIEEKRLSRQMKFPTLGGRRDVDSFRDPQNPGDIAFKKWNDEGDHRPAAPLRSCDNIIDPVSGFVSVAGDVDRTTGRTRIASLVQLNDTPQSYNVREYNSIRSNNISAPPDTNRVTETDPGTPYSWNSRHVSDAKLRANLGGWTSDKDPRENKKEFLRGEPTVTPSDESKSLRDKLALRYMYTSSAQRAYGEVPWDNSLAPRKWSSPTTLEDKPDMISQTFTRKRYDPAASEWQSVGREWDWFQPRNGNYKTGIPIPGVVFCSPCPRTGQIPNYGGCIGGENITQVDNPGEKFNPYTVKRVPIPRPTDTAHRPNIPAYTGCTIYRSTSLPAHASATPPEPQTTARVHRQLPTTPNTSGHRRDSQMSKMITTVPPCNPFNKIEWTPIPAS